MEPAIPVGSIVVIKPANPNTLKIGDIICFKIKSESSTTVTHRIFNITDEGFITKGDANEDPDQWIIKKENIIGKVIAVIPYLGYLGHFVRTPIEFTLLIIIPATLLIILEIKNIIKETKNQPTKTKIYFNTKTKITLGDEASNGLALPRRQFHADEPN